MEVYIPADLNAFIHRLVQDGRYESEEAVLIAAVRFLQERERQLDELRAELQPALDSLDRGEGVPLDFEDIKRRGRQRLADEGKTL
jgi:putative addiction module CopG family antidote